MTDDLTTQAPAEDAQQFVRGLAETAAFFEVTAPTVRAWIDRGCPVERKGGHGVSYALDLRKVAAWRRDQAEAEAEADARRAEVEEQLRLELLGPDAMPSETADRLTPKQEADWLRGERERIQIAALRRKLVEAAALERDLARVMAQLSERLLLVPDELGRIRGWSDEEVEAVREKMGDLVNDAIDAARDVLTAGETAVTADDQAA
ncbi:DUF1441 family protein [Oceanibacterium hippocampi]|uniref:Phage DNA packaging protein Nu1 n=1 Tax=Oceanibacterium hippocampi TaxID=745714 RepID=A0A1Y5U5A5_9PROT|nr:DUF1441 family protein [Oceanibacterium hippocampi]SLN77283.1 Phage DNA packaging protein Nu1 [Oceanibacterium hippocampi]